MPLITPQRKIWFNKIAAIIWAVAGIASFPFGWAYTIWFVVICSIWANVFASWSTAEAADDRELKNELAEIKEMLRNGRSCTHSCNCGPTMLSGGGSAERSSGTLESGSPGSILRSTRRPIK